MHFGSESTCRPSLKKAGGDSIAGFEFGHRSTDRNNFPGSVRQWYPPRDWVTIILPTENNEVTIVERSRFEPNHHVVIAGIRRRPIHNF